MSTFASTRARKCFIIQCTYFSQHISLTIIACLQQFKDLLLIEVEFRRVFEHKFQFSCKVFQLLFNDNSLFRKMDEYLILSLNMG